MKYIENIKSIADLNPDYLGFIFYNRSKRNFTGTIPELPKHIKKTGVFVNEELSIVVSLQEKYQLQAIQLHGDESVAYVQELKRSLSNKIEIIKVVGLKNDAYFEELISYEKEVDYFLFDTKGKDRGGNGVKFDWSVLKEYPFSKPFFLSGGIEINDLREIEKIVNYKIPLKGIDINSKFEIKPGLKDFMKVEKLINKMKK